ncbi:Mlc titration factor A [Serratia marcescens]|uniref:Mlc titration factor A n=1 Tax=Serratia marcescens TaxID=615 RepID=A0A379Z5C3_SERMA|nr:Mlc titration factor A [Serratia marcescens]
MIKWPWKATQPSQPQADIEAQWQDALAIPLLSPLNEQERQRLVAVAGQILQQKRIVPLQGLQLTSQMQARIALLFALPVLELGAECLDGFNEILLYPTPFVVEDEWQDGDRPGALGAGGAVRPKLGTGGRSCSTGKTCRTLSISLVSIW